MGIASLGNIFSKCDSVLQNDPKGAGFLGCCVLLLIEITIGKKVIFLDNSVQEGMRNEVKPICDAPKETREEDLAFKEQLVDQKLQAALKPKDLVEKRLLAGIPKFSITPSKRAVIDLVRFNNGSKRLWNLAVAKLSDLAQLMVQRLHGLLFNQECYKQTEKYLHNNYGHPDPRK